MDVYFLREKIRTVRSKDIRWSPLSEFPSCQTIDITSYFDFNTASPTQIYFIFNNVENLGVSLNVVERNKILKRSLKVSPLYLLKIDSNNTILKNKTDKEFKYLSVSF